MMLTSCTYIYYLIQKIVFFCKKVSKNSPIKGDLFEFKNILTGIIHYNHENIKGTLKLKKDPILEEIKIDNIGLKGMKLCYCDWIIGIILNTEDEHQKKNKSFSQSLSHFQLKNNTTFKKNINIMNLILLGTVLILSVIGHYQISSENNFLNSSISLIGFRVLLSNLIFIIPGNITILIDFLSTFYKFFIQKTHGNRNILIRNPKKLSCMDNISHLIFDGNIAINKDQTKIHSIYFPKEQNNFYLIPKALSHNHFQLNLNNSKCLIPEEREKNEKNIPIPYEFNFKAKNLKEKKSFPDNLVHNHSENMFTTKEEKKFSIIYKERDENRENLDIIDKSLFYKYPDIQRGLLLCHDIRSKMENKVSFNEYGAPDSELILSFLSKIGYKFENQCSIFDKLITCYNISMYENPRQYYIIAKLLEKCGNDKNYYKYSIVLNESLSSNPQEKNNKNNCEPFLLMRTDDFSFLDHIDIDSNDREILWLKLETLKSKGMRPLFFYQCKNINSNDLDEYIQHIKSPQSKEFKEIQKKIETKCELLTVLCIKEKASKKIKSLISDFQTIQNKIWIVSNDNKEKTLAIAYSMNLLPQEIEKIELGVSLNNVSKNELWTQMSLALKKMKKLLNFRNIKNSQELLTPSPKSKNRKTIINFDSKISENSNNGIIKGKFNLIVNGKILNLIKNNDDFKSHFSFIASFCQSFIGYNITCDDKEFLIGLIKDKFPFETTVLALGESKDDIGMMEKADISVELTKTVKNNSLNGDFVTNNLCIIHNLIRVESLIFNEKISTIILICYSTSFLTVMPYFVYSVIFDFFPGEIVDPLFYVLKDGILFNIISFVFFLWGESFNINIIKKFVWTYKSGKQLKNNFYYEALFRFLVNSFIDAFFLLLFVAYGVETTEEGNIFLFEQMQIIFATAICLMMFQKFTFFFRSSLLIIFIFTLFSWSLFLVIAVIYEKNQKIYHSFNFVSVKIVINFITNGTVISCFLYLIFYQAVKSFINKTIHHFFIGNYQKIKNALNMRGNIDLVIESFSKINKNDYYDFNEKNVGKAINSIFKNEFIDISVQESNFFLIFLKFI